MKRILQNNSIIITALCIMIAIVWYLNYNGDADKAKLASTNDYDLETVTDGSDITETTLTENGLELSEILDTEEANAESTENADLETVENYDDLDLVDGDYEEEDMADISDEDLEALEENQDVTSNEASQAVSDSNVAVSDTGEVMIEDESNTSTPGEAVLASTTIDAGYFASAKLTREQNRAREKENLLDMIENEALSEEVKQKAVDNMLALNGIMEKENATELLLEAKGFEGAVVSIIDDSVEVVINAPSITEQQIAQIESIVKRKTGVASAENIVIDPVVVNE